ncbi:MAG: GntR family transcriptional regulator [Rhodospirillaceae bacterium]|nr:GntR family transcriptional regulator [Rhodospirillaceae bacterium]
MPKLEHQTLNDRAYAALRKGLMSGEFRPGEVLTIRQLASRYGISVTPVREALQRLVAERALEMLRNRSIAVPVLTLDKFAELRRVRCLLEGLAAELATPNIKPADLMRLEQIIGEIDVDIAQNNVAAYLRRNEKFHFLIYERAQSPITLRIIQDLWTQVGPFFNCLFEDSGYLREANAGHRRILAALRRGDQAAVRESMVWDISEAAQSLTRRLVEMQAAGAGGAKAGPASRTSARRSRRARAA